MKKQWFALYTKSRAEKKVHQELSDLGFEVYLPLIKTLRQWSDRKKKVELPLIPSYVFVKVNEKEAREVLEVYGAVAYITFEGKKVPIPESQMTDMKRIVEHDVPVEASAENIQQGDKVRIVTGPLRKMLGEVVEISGKRRFVVRIDMGYSLLANIQGAEIERVHS